jgi:hypothetical protein
VNLGINVSNISAGGGVTHLAELLQAARPEDVTFNEIDVMEITGTLGFFAHHPWLLKHAQNITNKQRPITLWLIEGG